MTASETRRMHVVFDLCCMLNNGTDGWRVVLQDSDPLVNIDIKAKSVAAANNISF